MRAFAAGADDPRYARDYLSRQYRLHRACEAALAAFVPSESPAGVPALDSWAAALGMLYVIEGSTLGLQRIRRSLVASGLAGWPVGSRFVRGYGDETAARWREFVLLLEALPAGRWPAAIDAAAGTFGAFLDTFREANHE